MSDRKPAGTGLQMLLGATAAAIAICVVAVLATLSFRPPGSAAVPLAFAREQADSLCRELAKLDRALQHGTRPTLLCQPDVSDGPACAAVVPTAAQAAALEKLLTQPAAPGADDAAAGWAILIVRAQPGDQAALPGSPTGVRLYLNRAGDPQPRAGGDLGVFAWGHAPDPHGTAVACDVAGPLRARRAAGHKVDAAAALLVVAQPTYADNLDFKADGRKRTGPPIKLLGVELRVKAPGPVGRGGDGDK